MTGSLHIGLAALGSAIGVGIIGMKAAEATGRNPGAAGAIRNQAIIFAALAEGVVFFAIFLGQVTFRVRGREALRPILSALIYEFARPFRRCSTDRQPGR